ncbi:MAG: HEAT repeat domain-containing protein [Polyangiaceae bacterium]|nr:HEAT repeat domain-containing protein [Polyangiaceae bacterium]
MLDRPNSSTDTPRIKGQRPLPGALQLAKWPPDDADVPGAPGGGMPAAPAGGGGGDVGDGDFRKGSRGGVIGAIVGVVLIAAVGAGVYFGMQQGHTKMTVDEIVKEKKNIFVLPKKDQLPLWRKWAAEKNEWALQQEALIQLAYAEDPDGVTHATNALTSHDHRVKGVCAQVLAYYGSPKADAAKPALLAALKEADDSDRPQIVWALVTLKEPAVFKDAMDQYRKGFLSKVERLGGGIAFDPEKLAQLVPLDDFAKLADDQSSSVRQLVATLLSRDANPKWTQTLIKLVKDKDVEVAREAATGLGKIGDETARAPLLEALRPPAGVDPAKDQLFKENRQKFLEALRDGIGGEGLVLALDSVKPDPPETEWFQTKQLFDMMKDVADPRTGESLVKWLETKKPGIHWQGEAGTRLAEIGDIRAAKYLGERMRANPGDVYKQENFWQADEGGHLSRTDLPRVVAARMLADLAMIHPDKKEELKAAEDGVLFWITDRPQPHANGLRFLAALNSEKAVKHMRDWAFPKDPLPKEGAPPPFPTAFETAQSALRYIGMMKDEQSFPKLLEQFKRKKDKKMDTTLEGMNGGGIAMLGMALRAVAYGAAQGLGQWGDPRAAKDMMEFIEDELWNEEARQAACEALAWCADDKTLIEVAKKAAEFGGKKEPRKQLIGACYAQTLSLKPMPGVAATLAELLKPEMDLNLRMPYARAIGIAGVDEETQKILWDKLQNPEVRNAAALALIMGGSPETAARTVAMYGDFGQDALNDLKDHYFRAFGYWSDEDFKRGNIYRYVANAEAIARIKVGDVTQDWSRQRLQAQFDNLKFDNGPHSETRVVLRYRLWQDAKGSDAERKKGAIMTLKFMKERGVLMALRGEQGDTGELARRAFFELMNPKALIPEDLKALQPKSDGKGDKQ